MKVFVKVLLTALFVLAVFSTVFAADEIDLQFVVVKNDGTDFDVKVQCKRNNANWDRLGSSNFAFYFNTSGLDNPSLLTAHNFSGGFYSAMTVTDNGSWASVNIDYNGTDGNGTAVPTSWMDVATVHFNVLNSSLSSGLVWRTDGAYAGYDDNESTWLDPGTFSGLDIPLPVQMTNIMATASQEDGITIMWRTESETNCAGFHVWRSEDEEGNFFRISTAMIPGYGNTSIAHEYSFNDRNVEDGFIYWYKIEEVSTDGSNEFYGPISVQGISPIPEEYTLSQNYPNPFNPTTEIRYQIPEGSRVSLIIYNLLGKEVIELVDEEKPAGFYSVIWDGRDEKGCSISSGIYFYRLKTDSHVRVRKMTKME